MKGIETEPEPETETKSESEPATATETKTATETEIGRKTDIGKVIETQAHPQTTGTETGTDADTETDINTDETQTQMQTQTQTQRQTAKQRGVEDGYTGDPQRGDPLASTALCHPLLLAFAANVTPTRDLQKNIILHYCNIS